MKWPGSQWTIGLLDAGKGCTETVGLEHKRNSCHPLAEPNPEAGAAAAAAELSGSPQAGRVTAEASSMWPLGTHQ